MSIESFPRASLDEELDKTYDSLLKAGIDPAIDEDGFEILINKVHYFRQNNYIVQTI